jgi:hypothetical protein
MNNVNEAWKDSALDAFNQRKLATGRSPQGAVPETSAPLKEQVQQPTRRAIPTSATPSGPQACPDAAPSKQTITIKPLPLDPALTTKQAAPVLNESFETLKKWRQRKCGPAYIQYESGAIRYRLSVLMQYQNERTVKPTPKKRRRKA